VGGAAERIDPQVWVHWLVKRHGFHRLPNPEHDPALLDSLTWSAEIQRITKFFGVFPLLRRGDLAYLVALRPDLQTALDPLKSWLRVNRLLQFALSPAELTTWRGFTSIYQ
jgi:hypothetical protein